MQHSQVTVATGYSAEFLSAQRLFFYAKLLKRYDHKTRDRRQRDRRWREEERDMDWIGPAFDSRHDRGSQNDKYFQYP